LTLSIDVFIDHLMALRDGIKNGKDATVCVKDGNKKYPQTMKLLPLNIDQIKIEGEALSGGESTIVIIDLSV